MRFDLNFSFGHWQQVDVEVIDWHRTGDKPAPQAKATQIIDVYMRHEASEY